ncbi:MAG: glycosyltransferase family 39 protein [Victivallales bacterium]
MDFALNKLNAYIVVFLIWAGIYLPGLGTLDINFNEGRRIMPAVGMIDTGNWRTPSLAGNEYFKKPPMINWLIAGSFLACGDRSEFAARLPAALFMLAFVSTLVLMSSELLSLKARFMGAILFMTAYGSFDNGRQIEIDSIYAAITGIATVCWLNLWTAADFSRLRLWLITALIIGFGLLVKGPLILLFFYAVVLSVVISERRSKELLRYEHFAGIAIMCMIFFSWAFLINAPKTHSEQMATTWLNEIVLRFTAEDVNLLLWIKRVLGAVMGYLPWLVLIPFLWIPGWVANLGERNIRIFKACRLALILSFAVVNLMPGTKARYSFPLFCLAFTLLGWLVSVQPSMPAIAEKAWRRILLFLLTAVAAVSAIAVALIFVVNSVPGAFPPRLGEFLNSFASTETRSGIFFGAMLVCLVAYSVYRERKLVCGYEKLVLASGVAVAAVVVFHASFVLPAVEKRFSKNTSETGKLLSDKISGNVLYSYQIECEPFLFYVKPRVEFLVKPGQLGAGVKYLLSRDELLAELSENNNILESRNPREILAFKRGKANYRLLELD